MQHTSYILLSPAKEEDLRLSFGHTEALSLTDAPHRAFEPAIQQFKKFAVGPYFWIMFNATKWETEACGGSFKEMLGITEKEIMYQPPNSILSKIHPEDSQQMFAFTNYWVTHFMQLPDERKAHNRATMYIRMLNASNVYNWMMIQYADQLLDNNGHIQYGLTLTTNIQHIKTDGIASMSILDTFNETCQQFVCVDGKSLPDSSAAKPSISKREIEVMRLLAQGNSSKQIADILNLAQKTIDNHRQNMLHKTGCQSTGALIAYGIKNGYV